MQAVYIILVGGMLYALYQSWAYDDPFISYRYARNLTQGFGFVYNPSERVLSTTTPFFTLLLSGINLIWSNLPQAAVLSGALCLAWGGISFWKLGQAWKSAPVSWVGVSLYPTFPLLLTTLGSEIPLFLAACLAAVAAYAQNRAMRCSVFSAIAVLTRPDGVLLIFIFGTLTIIRAVRDSKINSSYYSSARQTIISTTKEPGTEKHSLSNSLQIAAQPLINPFLLFTALTLPWIIFAWFYFGSPIPATLFTKQHQASMEISRSFSAGLVNLVKQLVESGDLIQKANVFLLTLLALIGLLSALLKFWSWIPLLIWPMIHFMSYAALGVSGYFWYYAPLVPGFLAASGLGMSAIQQVIAHLKVTSAHRNNPPDNLTPFSRLISFGLLLLFGGLVLSQVHILWKNHQNTDPRVAVYRAIGEWLYDNTAPDTRIGALEVGVIGYYSGRYMIDFAGLLQPATALLLKPGNTYQDAALWAIEFYRPEYVVLHRSVFPHVEQQVNRRCTLAQQFSGAAYNYTGNLDIYHCPDP